MTEVQAAAIAKADASTLHGRELYEQRSYLWRLTCFIELRDLKRLNELLGKLSKADLKQIAAYAEALAEWDAIAQSCSGGQKIDRTTPGEAAEGPPTSSP